MCIRDSGGVSHACDFPSDAREKPVVSKSIRDVSDLSSQEIDEIIQQARSNNNPVHWIDGDVLRDVSPDLIITQELCEVCAVGSGSVFETAAKVLEYSPEILTVRPASLDDIFNNILRVGDAANVPDIAQSFVGSLKERVERITSGLAEIDFRPRVFLSLIHI